MKKSYKVVLLGDASVGKSSVAIRSVQGIFNGSSVPTITGEFFLKRMYPVNKDEPIDFLIWDTAGQERFNSIVPVYTRGAKVILFVFDLTKYQTFKNILDTWLNVAKKNVDLSSCVVYFLGNKCDLEYDNEYDFEKVVKLIELHVPNGRYFMVSAKDGTNIDLLFYSMAIDTEDFEPYNTSSMKLIEESLVYDDYKDSKCC